MGNLSESTVQSPHCGSTDKNLDKLPMRKEPHCKVQLAVAVVVAEAEAVPLQWVSGRRYNRAFN